MREIETDARLLQVPKVAIATLVAIHMSIDFTLSCLPSSMEPTHHTGRPLHMKLLSSRRKVQIVYYLQYRHGGPVDHPHLIEDFLLPVQDGLRLKDFKNWLAVLRGKGMPNAFSWSYKRSYKGSYIWQDLSDDDLIKPLQKHEYVLMGSELQNAGPGLNSCMCNGIHSESIGLGQRQVVDTKLRELIKEGNMNTSPKDSPKKNLVQLEKTMGRELCPTMELNMQASMTGFSDCDTESVASTLAAQKPTVHVVSMMTDMPESLVTQKQRRSGEVKVYKAREMEQTTDAATQTGESKRCSTEEYTSVNAPNPAPAPPSLQYHLSSSLQSMTTHHHHPVRRTPSFTSVPLDIHGTLHMRPSLPPHNQGLCHGEQQDLYYGCSGPSMSMVSVPSRSEMLYSPSSVHSSCTVQETVSPGSARSLRSINSMNSSRFSTNPLSVVDDQYHGSSNAGHHHGSHSAGATPSKVRLCTSSHPLKQLLSCSSVDISESSTLNLKSMSVHDHLSPTILNTGHHNEARGLHGSRSHGNITHRHGLQEEGVTSPPMTPKSWLCHPCGAHSLCFTPSQDAVYSNDHVRGLSREGSMKDLGASIRTMNCSPDSLGSKRSSPFPQNLSPPQLSLNSSSDPRARHLLYGS